MSRFAIALVLALAVVAPARGKCPFQKSCTKSAFKCFKTKGACTDTGPVGGGFSVCWANGAELKQTPDTITVLGKKGKPCLTGTIGRSPTGEFQMTFVRKHKSYVFTAHPGGTKSFTCPNGKVETYSGDDFRAGEVCGHIPVEGIGSACTQGGTCP